MSSTDRGRISHCVQTDCALIPTDPAWQIDNITSASLGYQKQTVESAILDSSAQPVDTVKVGAKSAGSMSIEWAAGPFDTFLEAGVRGAFDSVINHTGAVTVTAGTKTIAATGAFGSAKVGQWILLGGMVAGESYAGAGDSTNNNWFEIDTVSAPGSVVVKDPRGLLVTEAGPSTATVKSKRLLNGTLTRCYAIEEGLLDVSTFFVFLGQRVSSLGMTVTAGQIVTGEIAFMGSDAMEETVEVAHTGVVTIVATTRTVTATGAFADAVVGQSITISGMVEAGNNVMGEIATIVSDDAVTLTADTTTLVDETGPATAQITGGAPSWSAGGAYTPASSAASLNATNNVGDIIVDGDVSTSCFRTLTLNITNNLRETQCIANEFPRIDYGTPALTGNFEKLFANSDLWRKMRDHETVALEFGFIAPGGGAGIHVSVPEIYLNTDAVDLSGGRNSDVYDKVDFSASKHTNGAGETYYVMVCVA